MAEAQAAAAGGKSLVDLLKTKIGPAPLGVWGVAGLGLFWWWEQQRKRSSAGSAAPGGGQQIDPAGNVGTIDPTTGYVQGSPEDTAAIGQAGSSSDTGGSSQAGSGATVAGQYATNDDWGRAAVNYLVGLGVDPTTASQAVQQYLQSQTLTTSQQGSVNLAIQALGAPPTIPQPSQTNPTPVNPAPGSGPTASNPPTGVAIVPVNTTRSTLTIGWKKVANATGYTVSIGTDTHGQNHETVTVPASWTQNTFGSLQPGTTYHLRVQATPAAPNAAAAIITGTTPKK